MGLDSVGASVNGQVIITDGTTWAPYMSGGIVLGSGPVQRVIINVPTYCCSGDVEKYHCCNSGEYYGVWIGGRSGTGYEPIPGSGCLISGHGLFVQPGHQKEIYVQKVEEIHVAGVGWSGMCGVSGIYGSGVYNGWPVTWLGEQ